MVLEDLKVASLMSRKINELLEYNRDVQENLEVLRRDFHKVRNLVETGGKRFEASILEPFPREGYAYSLGKAFKDVSELKGWATDYLANRVIVAVDGSQIGFDQHVTPKVAMVQTGYIVMVREESLNDGTVHQGTFPRFYTPRDLTRGSSVETEALSTATIPYWRWKHEIATLRCVLMRLKGITSECEKCPDKADCPLSFTPLDEDREVVALMDGTLILSFLTLMRGREIRKDYIATLEELLRFCEKNSVILAGYIVNSNAREVSKSLWALVTGETKVDERELPTDALLFNEHLKSFGDRTPFTVSHRHILSEYEAYKDRVGFFYVRTDSQMPTRIEVPLFVYGWDKLDVLWRSIAAESVLGRGYPYTLARAHELAVIKGEDRRRFYMILDKILSKHGGRLVISSKNRRKNVQIV